MRFNDYDSRFAILRSPNGRPIKINADEASNLSTMVFEYNETLYTLLLAVHEKEDSAAVEQLWATAHPFVSRTKSGCAP